MLDFLLHLWCKRLRRCVVQACRKLAITEVDLNKSEARLQAAEM